MKNIVFTMDIDLAGEGRYMLEHKKITLSIFNKELGKMV